ncbi:MAG TPA: hypothetical protein VNS55_05590 [Nocardioides sp.]|nr:hypothetical protein [Nocardioides sp.]
MAPNEAQRVQIDLLDIAWRLADEHPELPAGTVLRCFARAVRTARACGVALGDLTVVAERIARTHLDSRVADRPLPLAG